MSLLQDPPKPHRIAISETVNLVAASDGYHKLIVSLDGGDEWLFDVIHDPGETLNLIDANPNVANTLRTIIRQYLSQVAPMDTPGTNLDPRVRQQLRALGYIE